MSIFNIVFSLSFIIEWILSLVSKIYHTLHHESAKISIYIFWKPEDDYIIKRGKGTLDIIEECMKMTSFGGQAKSLAMQAVSLARLGDLAGADKTMVEAGEYLTRSHEAHTNLLSTDAENEGAEIHVTLFMVHAADHLSSADTVCLLAEEIIHLYRRKEG
jgi:PTS system cellobiose-specific IIA component